MAVGIRTRSSVPDHVAARSQLRDVRLAVLGFDSYRDYLISDQWADVKARYRSSSLPQECICGERDVHLHHLTYERVGCEWLTDLMPLCRGCHELVHDLERRGRISLNLDGLVLDSERATAGRAALTALVDQRRQEREGERRAQQEHVLSLPFATRLMRAVEVARKRGRRVNGHLRLMRFHSRDGRGDEHLTWRLRKIEEFAYGWEGWGDRETSR